MLGGSANSMGLRGKLQILLRVEHTLPQFAADLHTDAVKALRIFKSLASTQDALFFCGESGL